MLTEPLLPRRTGHDFLSNRLYWTRAPSGFPQQSGAATLPALHAMYKPLHLPRAVYNIAYFNMVVDVLYTFLRPRCRLIRATLCPEVPP